jgi:hypothetical protein
VDWQKFSNIGAFVVALVFLGVQSYVWYKHGDIGVSSLVMLGLIAIFLFAAGIINYKAFHARPGGTTTTSKSRESLDERMLLRQTPEDLVALYGGATQAQGDRLVQPCIGKLMEVTDKVGDVKHTDGRSTISFPSFGAAGIHVIMLFDEDWLDPVSVLTMGQQITVRGKLKAVDAHVVCLDHCKLIG